MCCGNRSRPVARQPSQVVAGGGQQPSLVQSQAPVGQVNPVNPPNVSNPTNVSSLGRSKLIDKQLQKSQVRVQQIPDPSITNFFQNAKTQRIQIMKITNEHNSYVRQFDYFDLSSGHRHALENIQDGDLRAATYTVADGNTLSTPTINRFYYDKNVTDVGFVPHNPAYQTVYTMPTSPRLVENSHVQPYDEPERQIQRQRQIKESGGSYNENQFIMNRQ